MTPDVPSLLKRALQARREGRLGDAARDLRQAAAQCSQTGSRSEIAQALTALGQIERDLHHGDIALQLYQEAVAIYRDTAPPLRLAHAVRHVADIQRELGNPNLAEPLYNEALAIYRAHPEAPPLDLANAIRGLALLKSETGEIEPARLLWQEAKNLYKAVGVPAGVAESEARLASLRQSQQT